MNVYNLGVGGWPLGYEERWYLANCPCNYFPRFSTYMYVVLIHQRLGQTDGQHVVELCRRPKMYMCANITDCTTKFQGYLGNNNNNNFDNRRLCFRTQSAANIIPVNTPI